MPRRQGANEEETLERGQVVLQRFAADAEVPGEGFNASR